MKHFSVMKKMLMLSLLCVVTSVGFSQNPTTGLNPYQRVESEPVADSYGLKFAHQNITDIHNGDWLKLSGVNFDSGKADWLKAGLLNVQSNGYIEFFLDAPNGKRFAKINVEVGMADGDVTAQLITRPKGVHDVYLYFRGDDGQLFDLDYWQLTNVSPYRNPILYADVPDMSACRAGEYFYMVSTTMHLMPGAPIMRSKDMQHWETVSYVFPRIEDGDRYDLIGETTYGKGQWASSIRYHNGRFYVWFSCNGAPGKGFIYTTTDPTGEWTLLSRPVHHHDASLLFDDDGKVYLFYGTGQLRELKEDLSDVKPGGIDMKIFERDADEQGLLEGSQAFKYNGKYYLMMISMDWGIPGRLRREVCYRADKITGPYEKKVILETPFEDYGGVGQGCIVEGVDGEWYGIIFQDRNGVGRTPCLMPCHWVDGWPILGDAEGKIPNNTDIPHTTMAGICGSDEFDSTKLSLYWQWNHNPIDDAWSLKARPGYMRLKTARIVDNLFMAPNTLTQRMPGTKFSGVVKLDLKGMKDGDRAGLSAFNGDSGVLTIECNGKKKQLVMSEQKTVFERRKHAIREVLTEEMARIDIKQNVIYLRVEGEFFHKDLATFSYSLDGKKWIPLGRPIQMVFDYRRMFMGSKFAIFNYATKQLGGYVDVDYFRMENGE